MRRHAAAVVLAVIMNPAVVFGQSLQFTVDVQSAAVHKAPTTASPVIGRAPRGTVLEVTRDIGSWVKVSWPGAEDGAGYVHETMGTLAERRLREGTPAGAFGPAADPAATATVAPVAAQASGLSAQTHGMTYVAPPTHLLGVGGRMGGFHEFGATARFWSRHRFGVQVEALRSTMTSAELPGRVTSFVLAPSLMYLVKDHVTDNIWVRPYVGGGAAFNRASFKITPDTAEPLRDSTLGFQAFGGTEITFPGAPRFAISAEVGHLWSDEAFPGFDDSGMRVSLSGHWYVK